MEIDVIATLQTLEQRKKLLGLLEDGPRPPNTEGARRRPLEDPFPLSGGKQKVTPKKFSTLPRKPKRTKMADKPPLAPRPQAKPRRKVPPPIKPVPYHKHREHKEQDISTFKSNCPLQPGASKTAPPVPAEKPVRRYSAKGEPSSEFYQPKKVEKTPIQYGVPLVPGRAKGDIIESRPRLDTPYIPSEPPVETVSNGSPTTRPRLDTPYIPPEPPVETVSNGSPTTRPRLDTPYIPPEPSVEIPSNTSPPEQSNEPEAPTVSALQVRDSTIYSEAYGHIGAIEGEDAEGYAVVPRNGVLAKQPKRSSRSTPPPESSITPKPLPRTISPSEIPPVTGPKLHPKTSPSPDLSVGSAPKLSPRTPPPRSPISPKRPILPPPYNNQIPVTSQQEDIWSTVPPQQELVPSSAAPLPEQPTEYTEVPAATVRRVEPVQLERTPSPSLADQYNRTGHSPPVSSPANAQGDTYSKLNRPNTSPIHGSTNPTQGYSVLSIPPVSPPLAGNPTQQAGYGQLNREDTQPNAEYADINSSEPQREFLADKPKVKARNASQKLKKRSVQMQSTSERSDFSVHDEDSVPIKKPSPPAKKKPPPVKPIKPPLTYHERRDSRDMLQDPIGEQLAPPSLSNQELESAGYETIHTLSPEPDEKATSSAAEHVPRQILSPKVEVDIDLIRQLRYSLVESEESSGNQLIDQAVGQEPPAAVENAATIEESQEGVVLLSPDMFIVPQHAVAGPLGYCDIDLRASEQHQPEKVDTTNPGAGEIKGDEIRVKHNFHPDVKGYCDLSLNSSSPPTFGSQDALYCDIKEENIDARNVSSGHDESPSDSKPAQGYSANNPHSSAHTYELVPEPPKVSRSQLEDPSSLASKSNSQKPETENGMDSVSQEETITDIKIPTKAATVDVPQRPKRSRPRRAPPPPPSMSAAAADDNILPRKDTGPQVTGGIATMPRGASLLKPTKLSPIPANSDSSSGPQQQGKLKASQSKSIPPYSKSEASSPTILKRIFSKKTPNSPDRNSRNRRKKSFREPKTEPPVSPSKKANTLPPTGRMQRELPVPTLDSFDGGEDSDMYATIAETMPSPNVATVPSLETKRPSEGRRDIEARNYKQRASFRRKKVKKNLPVRRTNSAEHLYDTADLSNQNTTNNRARLPNPDEVHAGLYAVVTSRPPDTTPQENSTQPTTNGQPTTPQHSDKDKSLSPDRSSLYEEKGLVVTSLDKKFGTHKTEDEVFISSADIEHTVSAEGSVYAVVQTKKKKKKSSGSNEDTVVSPAEPKDSDSHQIPPPRKPPRSPGPIRKPPPYQPKSPDDTHPKTPSSPQTHQLTPTTSGPPLFPPPPPPKSKSVSPEAPPIDDPTYEVVDSTKKAKILSSAPPKHIEQSKSTPQNGMTTEDNCSFEHTDGAEGNALASQGLVHINDVMQTDSSSKQRPPHLYSTIQENSQEESPTVSIRMVSHEYETVTDKSKQNVAPKKKPVGGPRLPPRKDPPPPPPAGAKRAANPLPTHKPRVNVPSPPLGARSPDTEVSRPRVRRAHSFSSNTGLRTESSEPKFLFSQKLQKSLIAVGDSPEVVSSPLSKSASVDEDSDAENLYSTEWESSTDDEEDEGDERSSVHRPKTYYIAREILTTERTFVKGLTLLDKDFRQAVRSANNAHDKPVIADESMKMILGNVSSLLSLNADMLKELEERMQGWDEDPRIGDILRIRAPYFKIYTEYISKFDKALKTLDECTKKYPQFAEVVHEFEAQRKCASIPIAGYMLDIVQRITRYKLLMTDYVKHLPENSSDREDSEKALEAISSTATHVNETIRQMDNFRKVVEVRKRLIGDTGDTLITPYRKLLKEGELLKFSRKEKQPRMFFLFNDILIYASSIPPANTTYRVIKRIPLEGMLVEPLDDPEMKYGFQIVSTCKSFRLEASNREEKTQWITAFEAAIKEHTERNKNREKARQILMENNGTSEVDSVPLGHLAPPWLPDSAVSMCQLCSVNFTVTRRRHHCRCCGMIFCRNCSSYYAPLKYMNFKMERVCQSCYEKLDSNEEGSDKSPQKRPSKLSRFNPKIVNMPSVLREVKARDQNAQISGYLQSNTSKAKRWKKRWYVVYNLVLYEFERHEDVTAKKSITLPSYQVISPRHEDPLVFTLKHAGAGKRYFKVENEDQLQRWIEVLSKAVRGELEHQQQQGEEEAALSPPFLSSPEEPTSSHSLDSQEQDSSSSL